MTNPTSPTGSDVEKLKEQAARIIDAEAFYTLEQWYEIAVNEGARDPAKLALQIFGQWQHNANRALAKAEAIHALYATALEDAEARAERAEAALVFYRDNWDWFPGDGESPTESDPGSPPTFYEAEPNAALRADEGKIATAALSLVPIPGGDGSSVAESAAAGPSACAARDASRKSEVVWRVCHVIKGDCKRCPRTVVIDDEAYTRGCYAQAVETLNVVETGNPWRKTEGVKAPWVVSPKDGTPDAELGPGRPQDALDPDQVQP